MLACVPAEQTQRARPPAWFFVIVAAQVLVPTLVLLGGEVPSRFGFHMYSRSTLVEIVAVDASGKELAVDRDIVANLRGDLRWTGRLPEYVCERMPEAAAVTVTQLEKSRTVTCPR